MCCPHLFYVEKTWELIIHRKKEIRNPLNKTKEKKYVGYEEIRLFKKKSFKRKQDNKRKTNSTINSNDVEKAPPTWLKITTSCSFVP